MLRSLLKNNLKNISPHQCNTGGDGFIEGFNYLNISLFCQYRFSHAPLDNGKLDQVLSTRLINKYILRDPLALVRYNYVINNPINRVDPWGLWDYAAEYGTTGQGLTQAITSQETAIDSIFSTLWII